MKKPKVEVVLPTKITMTKDVDPSKKGGVKPTNPIHRLGEYAHPPKKKGGKK